MSNEAVRWLQSVSDRLSCNCLVIRQDRSASSASICCLKEARNALAFIAQRITWRTHGRSPCTGGVSKLDSATVQTPQKEQGVLVFLFFLFFIAGHYLGVLLVFNGDTPCFIGPCGRPPSLTPIEQKTRVLLLPVCLRGCFPIPADRLVS